MVDSSRRRFLKISSLTAATLAAGGALPETIRKALAVEPKRLKGTIEDVQHVVIFMQENRSFDHYFGALRGVRGFSDPRPMQGRHGRSVWEQPSPERKEGYVLPFHLDSRGSSAQNMKDLNHDWRGAHSTWQYNDVWAKQKTPMTMGHFKRQDMPFYYALADAFTICDGYHCSVFGPTNPNRMYLFTGTSGLSAGNDGKQVVNNEDDGNWTADMGRDHSDFTPYDWTTYAERLEKAGVSWKVYQEYDNYGDNALQSFAPFRKLDKQSPLYQKGRAWVAGSTAENARDSRGEHLVAAFAEDVRNGTLPQVSWLVAPYIMSEHPEATPGYGESLTARLLEALVANPEVWSRTVFLLNYDENGGFFDHIPTPLPAINDELGKSSIDTRGEDYHGEPVGLGPRVPMLAISPWSRGGWVNSQVFDHTSVLRFLEQRFGVEEPNISPWRRAVAGDLTSAFDFAGADPLWPQLPDTSRFIARVDAAAKLPPPQLPATQSMPVQEPGQRPARALPYNFDVSARVDDGTMKLALVNHGASGVAISTHDGTGSQSPRHYTAGAGATVEDSMSVGAAYDLTVHGPAGFFRHFAGRGGHRVHADIVRATRTDQVLLRLVNDTSERCTCRIHNNYTGETREHALEAGGTAVSVWEIGGQAHWYDLQVTLAGDEHYLRRFAGHVETGHASFSDPAIGSVPASSSQKSS